MPPLSDRPDALGGLNRPGSPSGPSVLFPPLADLPLTHPGGAADIIAAARPCACGSRMPLGVRLHLRSRTRPVFEGRWCCGPACLQARIAVAVRREVRREPVQRVHRHRIPLGLLLLAAGAVSQEDLKHALEIQQGTGERMGQILTRECGVSEQSVSEGLATQWGCPVWSVGGSLAGMAAVAPRIVLQQCGMLPLRVFREHRTNPQGFARENRLAVAFANAIDPQVVFALRWMHDLTIDAGVAPQKQWAEAQERMLQAEGVPVEEIECADVPEMEQAIVRNLRRLQPVESRWARVHDLFWLRIWLEPAALLGGARQVEDVMDFVYRLAPAAA